MLPQEGEKETARDIPQPGGLRPRMDAHCPGRSCRLEPGPRCGGSRQGLARHGHQAVGTRGEGREGEGRTRGPGWRRGLPGGCYGLQERGLSLAGVAGRKDIQRLCPLVLMAEPEGGGHRWARSTKPSPQHGAEQGAEAAGPTRAVALSEPLAPAAGTTNKHTNQNKPRLVGRRGPAGQRALTDPFCRAGVPAWARTSSLSVAHGRGVGPGTRKAAWAVRLGEPGVRSQSPPKPRHREHSEPHEDALVPFEGHGRGCPSRGPGAVSLCARRAETP